MKAIELRINNYVNYSIGKSYMQGVVRTINNTSCNITEIGSWHSLQTIKFKNIEGIPLTEEWLLKFGFECNELNALHNKIKWFGDHIRISGMLGNVRPVECKYVHQIQNLYFALTGNELTLK